MLAPIRDIINPDVVINYDTSRNRLKLKEEGADSKVKELFIDHMPVSALAFTLDHQPKGKARQYFKQLSLYVSSTNGTGVNKGCDLIILWQEADKKKALVFDLKSDKPNLQATQKQLDNSELFLKYLLGMASIHYGANVEDIEINKAIVITNARGVNKRPTYRKNSNPSSNGCYRVESVLPNASGSASISFRQLVVSH